MKTVCARTTGRHMMRRKKNCVLLVLGAVTLCVLVQMSQYDDGYTPLRPLADAKSEARRLLKFITHYHVQCNTTLQIGNRSHWPICIEKDLGLDVDVRDGKVAYSIGGRADYLVERELALNHSFEVVLVTHEKVSPFFTRVNNTRVVHTVIVPNDPADFSRNLYGQQTFNDLLHSLGHQQLDLLRLGNMAHPVQMWELLHFMIDDNLLVNVHQLHVAMYIDKLDDDYLYSWYRVLYGLFYKQGLRLYHTSSADSLCLQVTMMESCIYYMSFVKNPGTRVFVLYPPADYGTSELEEERLLTHLSNIETECKQQIVGGPNDENLQFTTPTQPQWAVCTHGVYELFPKPCTVFRFRLSNDHSLEQKFIREGCSVHTLEPFISPAMPLRKYKVHGHYPRGTQKPARRVHSEVTSWDSVAALLSPSLSLLELDAPGYEWDVLGQLLDAEALTNVSQLVVYAEIPHPVYGRHHTILRTRYSQLMRLHTLGFLLFHSSPESSRSGRPLGPNCCFKLGFIRRTNIRS